MQQSIKNVSLVFKYHYLELKTNYFKSQKDRLTNLLQNYYPYTNDTTDLNTILKWTKQRYHMTCQQAYTLRKQVQILKYLNRQKKQFESRS